MSNWTAGYVSDIDYTYGYYSELNPVRIAPILINSGIQPPKIESACELGFGQGVSIAIHAAASDVRWCGTDFNPNQALFAKNLVQSFQGSARICDDAFADFCSRQDLPDFDYIGLHGIWSWISDDNRHLIVDFVKRKLKLGGVLYVSYNTLPGWAANAPLRHLMTQHAATMGAPGAPLTDRIHASLDFTHNMLSLNAGFARVNPPVLGRLGAIKGHNPNYLAHEYFNKDWRLMYFSEMADFLSGAKLSFAGSAHYLDLVDGMNLLPEQIKALAEVSDSTLRQTVRDFFVNQQFRRDYWIKGGQRLSASERIASLQNIKVILSGAPSKFLFNAPGSQGEAELNRSIYEALLNALSNCQVQTIGELAVKLAATLSFEQVVEGVLVIAAKGFLQFVRTDGEVKAARQRTQLLNRYICERARIGAEVSFLASPVTGGGIAVNRFSQLFTLGVIAGRKTDRELGTYAWAILSAQGQRLVKEGVAIESSEENEAELVRHASEFLIHELPIMRALQIL